MKEAHRRVLKEAAGIPSESPYYGVIGLHRKGAFRAMIKTMVEDGWLEYVGHDTARITPAGRRALANGERDG